MKGKITPVFSKAIYSQVLGNTDTSKTIKVLEKLETASAYQNSAQKETEDYLHVTHTSYNKQVLNKLPKLKKQLLDAFAEYKNEAFEYRQNEFKLTTSWISKTSKGQSSFPHNHRNCMFSGVYYPQMDEKSASIFFEDTSDQRFNVLPSKWNMYNTKEIMVKPVSDMVLFFPSEMYHIVGTHKSNKTRYCIAMNFMPIGKLGAVYLNLTKSPSTH
mgnify:FL=1